MQAIKMNEFDKHYHTIFEKEHDESPLQRQVQERLAQHYKSVLSPPMHFKNIPDEIQVLTEIRAIEEAWNRVEEHKIKAHRLPEKHEFVEWYTEINQQHKAKVKPFFNYLATQASLEELAIYICLEERVDGSFDDTIALAQLGVQGKAKMVMAENYWDEMGNGHEHLVHTTMFSTSASYMRNILKKANIDLTHCLPNAALKNGNILMMYGLRRRYIPRLLGAIGILEDTASERFQATVTGLERYKLPYEVIQYHRAHIQIDSKHGKEWLEFVLIPGVQEGEKAFMEEVCRGILIRFNIASAYYAAIESTIQTLRESLVC